MDLLSRKSRVSGYDLKTVQTIDRLSFTSSVKLETRMGSTSSLYSAIAISSGDIESRKSIRPDSLLEQ